jgi:hypothetical protein
MGPAACVTNTPCVTINPMCNLGLIIMNNMHWNNHIDKIVKKASSRVYLLNKL